MVAKNATVIGHFVKRRIENKGHDDATLVFVLEVILWRVLTDWSMSRESNSYGKGTEDLWYGKWLKKQYIQPGQEFVGSVEWEENWTKAVTQNGAKRQEQWKRWVQLNSRENCDTQSCLFKDEEVRKLQSWRHSTEIQRSFVVENIKVISNNTHKTMTF